MAVQTVAPPAPQSQPCNQVRRSGRSIIPPRHRCDCGLISTEVKQRAHLTISPVCIVLPACGSMGMVDAPHRVLSSGLGRRPSAVALGLQYALLCLGGGWYWAQWGFRNAAITDDGLCAWWVTLLPLQVADA